MKTKITKNSKGLIFKAETVANLKFPTIKDLAKKHGLVITNDKDYLTLNISGLPNSGLRVEDLTNPSSYNRWTIFGLDMVQLKTLQPFFKELQKV